MNDGLPSRQCFAVFVLMWAIINLMPHAAMAEGACTVSTQAEITWHACEKDTLWIIETRRPITLFWSPTAVPTLRERAAAAPDTIVMVNGGYHDGNYAQPHIEGLFVMDGTDISPLKPADPQLTHVLSINRAGSIDAVEKISALSPRQTGYTYFQSGPLITDRGRIEFLSIKGSLNGNDPYKRTAIGRTRTGETVIVIAKTPRTLRNLARSVLRINSYKKRQLTLLNLDGGPSTAIHAHRIPALSYGADKVTPVGISVR